jgi:DNA-binding Lrp family transcriptional regulator
LTRLPPEAECGAGRPILKAPKLDQIDVKILAALQRSGRITNQDLSALVGLSPRPCLERVRRLEHAGLIDHYMAVLNLAPLPDQVAAFAEISLKSHASHVMDRFEQHLRNCPEVVECHMIGGEFDYLAHIVCPSLERYTALTAAWSDDTALDVARIVSNFVMRPVRHFAGVPVDALLPKRAPPAALAPQQNMLRDSNPSTEPVAPPLLD